MTESKFLNFILTEGILALSLGLGVLIIPKISLISLGFMMCFSFVAYGGYKIINTLLTKNFSRHFIVDILVGAILATSGLILFAARFLDIMLVIGLIGIYFVLKSISSTSFGIQTRKTLNFWWLSFMLSIIELLFSFIVIIMLPSAALWLIGVLTGLDFILSGLVLINMYISTKYTQIG